MNYYVSKILKTSFNDALARVEAALADQGFEILSDIDVQEVLGNTLKVTFRNYRILGVCNPLFAHKALLTEDKIGTMLPCNVIVQEKTKGRVEAAFVNLIASMIEIENTALMDMVGQVQHKIGKVIDQL